MQPSPVIDTVTDAELELEPDRALIELAVKLAGLERGGWRPRLAALRAAGVPLNAEDDDDAGKAGKDDDDAGKTGKDDDDDGKDGKGKAGKDDDDDDGKDDDVRAALAAANREVRRLKREREEEETKAKADAGKYKELYEETKAELEKVKSDNERGAKERLAVAALTAGKARNPARAVKLLDLDGIDDEATAERAVKRLQKSDEYLFDKAPTRQKRGAGGDDDDDDENDNRRNGGGSRRPVNRLRRGLEATTPK